MTPPRVVYRLDDHGRFIVEGYNWARAFSNFLPAIAGAWGVPLWTYYVSRAQAVCCLGVRDKDGQILEFRSFNKACLTVDTQGFRTFLRLDDSAVYEPFQRSPDPALEQAMIVSAGELVLGETNRTVGLDTQVSYFTLPNLPLGVLARVLRLRNLRRATRRLELLDGAPRLLPYGLEYAHSKYIARHIEAMMGVSTYRGIPLYRLRQSAADVERVEPVRGGHYYLPLAGTKRLGKSTVVDPAAIFGDSLSFDHPWRFEQEGLDGVLATRQLTAGKTPCAFAGLQRELPPGEEVMLVSLIGYAPRDEDLDVLLSAARKRGFVAAKRQENQQLLDAIMDQSFTASSCPAFDAYCRQNFLDNVIRGGMPMVFQTAKGPSAFYCYSRQNGDLERDYHWFVVEPSYLSQGTGHYRSVLQNRRCDTWFFPEVEDANLVTFLGLMQLDGYNPLEVGTLRYQVDNRAAFRRWLSRLASKGGANRTAADVVAECEKLAAHAQRGFSPGDFMMRLERVLPECGRRRDQILAELMSLSRECEVGGLHEGFWVDHWTYNLDLIDTYLAVYPDRLEQLLLGRADYTFFDDPDVVLPRGDKTILLDDGRVRRYGAVIRDQEKLATIAARRRQRYRVRTRAGAIYQTHLLAKLLCLVANRIATLDPHGVGMDMEADKPGWNDSMNGLPGLFGSSLCETLELLRCCRFLTVSLDELAVSATDVAIFEELVELMEALEPVIRRRLRARSARGALSYWDRSNTLKERYRAATRTGLSGRERCVPLRRIRRFVGRCQRLLEGVFSPRARVPILSPGGVPYTYFVNEVTQHRPSRRKSHQGYRLVQPLAWQQRPVRLFLEGPVHYLKAFPERAAEVYRNVRRSPLFDRKLRMYKSCEDMTGESPELGRAVGAYPRGWIENESIYLHMEYKYLLEVLRSGLCDEYFDDIRQALVPFQPPERYGRSILEGASFIVSSAYADPQHHGQAFQPRLSGITCEFVHAWTLMVAGPRPLRLDRRGRLQLALRPRLPGWLFTTKAATRRYHDRHDGWTEVRIPKRGFAFMFLGHTLVVYRNPRGRNTYGKGGVAVRAHQLFFRDGRQLGVEHSALVRDLAEAVRGGEVKRIEVELG